jgi:hypothetical protein
MPTNTFPRSKADGRSELRPPKGCTSDYNKHYVTLTLLNASHHGQQLPCCAWAHADLLQLLQHGVQLAHDHLQSCRSTARITAVQWGAPIIGGMMLPTNNCLGALQLAMCCLLHVLLDAIMLLDSTDRLQIHPRLDA